MSLLIKSRERERAMFSEYDYNNELYHYGVKGMKWGVRRYEENPSLKNFNRLHKQAIKTEYKKRKKNGQTIPFKRYRKSTGESFNKAEKEFEPFVKKDKKYVELATKAHNATLKKLKSEKSYINDDEKYDKYIRSKEYQKLDKESQKYTELKRTRLNELARQYELTIKDAKIKDLGISKHKDIAKQYIDGTFNSYIDDVDIYLEYNPDDYYDTWVDKWKYK